MGGQLEDRVAVITAAASGMGREASLLFAREGARIVALDINSDSLEALVSDIEAAGGAADSITVDMTDIGAIADAVGRIGSTHGRIDVLWNHAGAPGPRGFDFDEKAWDFSIAINLTAPVFLTKEAWPLLQQGQNGASVLFTSSVSGLIASRNSPVYSAVKSGVIGYMRCMAAIGGADGIRSNAIAPGAVETPMLQGFFGAPGEPKSLVDERLASFNQAIPLGRRCKPEEVAALGLFLSSDAGAYITGVTIPIDGGYTAL